MSRRISTFLSSFATAGAVVIGGAILGGGIATADTGDAQFLDFLTQHGYSIENPAGTIAEAKAICGQLNNGVPFATVVNQTMTKNPGLDTNDAGGFVGAAIGAYCPENQVYIPG